ncbi:PREDICTED: piggyBac transposable element-derived protein 3-like [Rhagoletis zephyria]|uniref:piggyBac transposable element-derived protein 3-like n=1 Tax=Rhagoletis zephyria TaxID=28612 RepID=UPI0008114F62|nr:PREDICTED: piggyBac transposable element-derived protein 3-like [Rhagoletis zephyria]XP_036347130.1 piggyBac transposable element-derived protein 3-like [Rhagoletis pomonella]
MSKKRFTEEEVMEMLMDSDFEGLSDDEDLELVPNCSNVASSSDSDSDYNAESDNEEENIAEQELVDANESPSNLQNKKPLKWLAKEFVVGNTPAADEAWNAEDRFEWTPFQYFSEYFDDDFWREISQQSNTYALENGQNLYSNYNEYKKLSGAHILAGCMKLPRVRMYYRPAINVPAITQIPRDRFFKLRNYMHFVDNLRATPQEKENNKLWKVEPIIKAVLKKCQLLPKPAKLSIDEQMIPFSGTTQLKQYVKGKPCPVGLKNFATTI